MIGWHKCDNGKKDLGLAYHLGKRIDVYITFERMLYIGIVRYIPMSGKYHIYMCMAYIHI